MNTRVGYPGGSDASGMVSESEEMSTTQNKLTFRTTSGLVVHIRWMVQRDMDEVFAIESEQFEFPWDEKTFRDTLRQRNAIGMVAEHDDKVLGFMIYELHKTKLRVLNFAVAKSAERKGIGRAMVDKLVGKLSAERRKRIVLEVRETNVSAQLFFRAMGFRAINVLKDFYEDWTTEDAYLMQYKVGGEPYWEAPRLSALGLP